MTNLNNSVNLQNYCDSIFLRLLNTLLYLIIDKKKITPEYYKIVSWLRLPAYCATHIAPKLDFGLNIQLG